MWHNIFIAAHAITGGLALLTGCIALRRATLVRTYLGLLIGMELSLTLAVLVEWPLIGSGARFLFTAFAVLGLFVILRAAQAHHIAPRPGVRPPARYVEHVGFTLVTLCDAFVVVGVLDLGAPTWLIVVSGILTAVLGHYGIRSARARLSRAGPGHTRSAGPLARGPAERKLP